MYLGIYLQHLEDMYIMLIAQSFLSGKIDRFEQPKTTKRSYCTRNSPVMYTRFVKMHIV